MGPARGLVTKRGASGRSWVLLGAQLSLLPHQTPGLGLGSWLLGSISDRPFRYLTLAACSDLAAIEPPSTHKGFTHTFAGLRFALEDERFKHTVIHLSCRGHLESV